MNKSLVARFVILFFGLATLATAFYTGISLNFTTIVFFLLFAGTMLGIGILLTAEIVTRFLVGTMGSEIQQTAQKLLENPDAINDLVKDVMAKAQNPNPPPAEEEKKNNEQT